MTTSDPASRACLQGDPAPCSQALAFLELTKPSISAAATFTAATGYLACRHHPDWGLPTALLGTLLLAMASSAFNEVQERELDVLMERTRHRPIPRGALGPAAAKGFAVLLAVSGFNLLFWAHGWTPALLGLLAMAWYNGFYTPLKRVSAFAVVPGSVIGALPPAIGWTAAGGRLSDPALLALAALLFLWQMPHFWLLSLLHRGDYQRAGFPTLSTHFPEPQILVFTSICAAVAACALLPVSGMLHGRTALTLVAAASLWLLLRATSLFRPGPDVRRTFLDINLFALAVMAAVILEAVG